MLKVNNEVNEIAMVTIVLKAQQNRGREEQVKLMSCI